MVSLAQESNADRKHRARWLVAAGVAIAGVLALASLWPLLDAKPVIGLINLMVAVALTATGFILCDEPQQRSTGGALMLAALFYLVSYWWSWPPEWQNGPFPLISYVFGYLWFAFGALALLRYPEPALARWWERAYVISLASWVVGTKLVLAAVSLPQWAAFNVDTWWPTIVSNRALFDTGTSIANIGLVVLAVSVLPLLLLKVRRAKGIDRVDSVPVVVAATTVTICGSIYLLARSGSLSVASVDTLRGVIGVATLFTPLAFLTTALRRRLARSSMADLIVRLVDSPSGRDIEKELRRSLPDPTLSVWFWLPREKAYMNVDDVVAVVPPANGRWLVPINTASGEPLAALLLDPVLQRHPGLVGPAVAACSFALENYRLHADLRAQLNEVQRSRSRIAQAELEGRQKIERALHDGAQQSLLAASASLGAARFKAVPGSAVYTAIDRASADLATATSELRQLARGIHPPVLVQSGLGPAIESVVERLGLPAMLSILADRLSLAVETTAYYVVCEALTNAAKHAAADQVMVRVERCDTDILIDVIDNGRGRAEISLGSGLAGLIDRVEAIGGSMTVDSAPGEGTTVRVVLPCA